MPLAVLGCYWVLLIYQLGAQWSVYDQYNYGWSVPFLCLFLLWRRVHGAPSISPPRPSNLYLPVILLALLYAATRWLHEANPIWRLTSLLWSLEIIGFTLCFLHLAGGWAWLRHFGFPIVFFLVAVPWPSGFENDVVQSLMRLNTGITVELLGWFGVPAMQHGNVIEISNGMVGIEEACSGIRSIQATLMIALFLGEMSRLRFCWRVLLVLGGFLMAFVFNVARTFLLTWVAAAKGMAAIASWHDPAGVTILVACFLALWLMATWLGKRQRAESRRLKTEVSSLSPILRPPVSSPSNFAIPFSTVPVRGLAVALLAWFVLVEAGVEWWYRSHETAVAANDQWTFNAARLGPGFVKAEIPSSIMAQFHSDKNMSGRWRDPMGNDWQFYYFQWLPDPSLKKRVIVQLAKTHGPETCLPAIGMTMKSNLGVVTVPFGGMQFAFRHYLFLAGERPLHVFYAIYEDPGGSAVLANRRRDTASRIAAAVAGSRNDGQRYLEFALSGFEHDADATAEFAKELPTFIEIRK